MKHDLFGPRVLRFFTQILPGVLFLSFFLWGWRVKDLIHDVPYYGDVLEVLWGITWYNDVWFNGKDAAFYPGIFHPVGWQVATFAHSPALFFVLVPLSKIGGPAFAYNMVAIGAFGIAFAGMYLLARTANLSPIHASLAATLFTFCGFHWLRIGGHLNQLLGSALIPWILWVLERAWDRKHFWIRWFVATGILWGSAAAVSFYFIWLGGVAIWGWAAARWLANRRDWQIAIRGMLVATLIAAVLSAPFLLSYARAMRIADVPTFDIAWTSAWGASLNSLPTPSVGHPITQFRNLARWLYRGPMDESGAANLGILASLFAFAGLWQARRDRRWWPIFCVTALGLVLALGYVLRWNGTVVGWPGLHSVDKIIWSLGHRLKPDLFRPAEPYGPYVQGMPLPSLLIAVVVPYWESARTLSRFAFIALPGFFLMAARGLRGVRSHPLQLVFALLLLIEILPAPSLSVSASPPAHPAFVWLQENTQPQDGLLDLDAPQPGVLVPVFGGPILLAGQYHHRATAAGAGSVWPAHTWFLRDWFLQHPKGLQDPELVPLLRYYDVTYILLHLKGANERAALKTVQQNAELQIQQCFDPPSGPSPWGYPICLIEIIPSLHSDFNLVFGEGWSGFEEWGVWSEGVTSDVRWVATAKSDYTVLVDAFPMCVPGKSQTISLVMKKTVLLVHEWYNDCGKLSVEVKVPASLVKVGWNEFVFGYAYAVKPVNVTNGQNPDERSLSVGFTRLEIKRQ